MPDNQLPHLSIVPGTKDILGREQEFFTYIKKVVRHRCRQSGFRRISTPTFELAELFKKGLGEEETKSLYQWTDQAGQSLVLHANGTIPLIRAYFGNKMTTKPQPVYLFYIEPFFLFRAAMDKHQPHLFYQFGADVIGDSSMALTAQLIQLAYKVLQDLGIAHLFKLPINNLGCAKCCQPYLSDFRDFYYGKERSLCANCKLKLDTNPWQLFNCTEDDCQILAELAPKIAKYLCKDCLADSKNLQSYLTELSIPFYFNPKLVLTASYYSGTIFKFTDLNDQKSDLGGGGRYDDLITKLGGVNMAGLGFALNIEKIIEVMRQEKIKVPSKDNLQVFVAQLGEEAKKKCLSLMTELREAGIKTVGTLGKGSMREQLALASQFKVPYMILMGLTEVREGQVIIRNMKMGSQQIVPFTQAVATLINLIGEENLDKYSPGEVLY